MLVVLMQAQQRGMYVEMTQEIAGSTRVFRRYERDRFQDPQCPKRDVFKVADWRGDDVERARRRGHA